MMKYVLASLSITFYSLTAQAETSIWKVSSGESEVYIGGTVHLLRASDYPLPPEFNIAYLNSDSIFFETDISALSEPSTQQKMLKSMTADPGKSLDKVLSEDTMEKLTGELSKRDMDINALMQFKPSLIITAMLMEDLRRLGVTLEGVDTYFNERAVKDGMPVGELESVEQQLSFLAAMGEGQEDEFVRSSLQDLDDQESEYDDLITAWRNGDRKQLESLVISEMKQESPEIYEQLFMQRNNNWLPQIKNMLKQPGTEYILVGVGHLVGSDGLLSRLEKEGYKVVQVSEELNDSIAE